MSESSWSNDSEVKQVTWLVWLYVEYLVPIVPFFPVDEKCWLHFESYSHHIP